jgi:hypothetical protein
MLLLAQTDVVAFANQCLRKVRSLQFAIEAAESEESPINQGLLREGRGKLPHPSDSIKRLF